MTTTIPGAPGADPRLLPASPAARLHGLDALRGLALLLGVVVHASLAFLPGAKLFWIVADPRPSAWLGLAFYVPHMFRMILFFLIAGFFGRLACERLGTAGFVRDRFRRIVLVLAAFWPVVFAGILTALVLAATHANGGRMPAAPSNGPAFTPDDFPLTHLWFLHVLTLCYAAMLAGRWVVQRLDSGGTLSRCADRLTGVLSGRIGPVLLAAPLAAALALTPGWLPWFGIPTPDRSLYPNLPASIAFGSAFVFGWWLHRSPSLMRRWARHWRWHLAVALGTTVACLALVGVAPAKPAMTDVRTALYAALYAWGGWSWAVALTGLALRYLDRPSPARRLLADASYWIYLMHLPLVMLLQVYAVRLPGPAPVRFAAVVAITLVVLLASYRLFVRRTWLGAFINGRRLP